MEMIITKDKFESYEAVRQSGITNMFDATAVCELSGLDRDEVMDIMRRYGIYREQFADQEIAVISRDFVVNFKAVPEPHKLRDRTGLMEVINLNYRYLIQAFGEPTFHGDGYKVDVEWVIETPDGIATIYNYKDGPAYLGDKGLPIETIVNWHIGGRNHRAAGWIMRALEKA